MKDNFTKNAAMALALILGLLVLDRVPALAKHTKRLDRVAFLVWEMHKTSLNADDYHALAAGYYEALEQVDPLLDPDWRIRDDFLRFEFRPGVKRQTDNGIRYSNRFGMANPDYGYEKPPHTRRIAWFGDSVSIGPYGHSFEMLLENRLNRDSLTPEVERYQILNFSVPGYHVLQKMDTALEKAPKFHPDVYVVQLDTLEITGSANHIAKLVVRGRDLKYDFLRRIAAQAGVRSTDHQETIVSKLKPFFIPMVRGGLERIRDLAASQGARMIVVLVSVPIDPDVTAQDFDALRPAADSLGVPVIDLRNTFRNANLDELHPDRDIHPNVRGHEMIFLDLYSRLRANPGAWEALTGVNSPVPGR